MMAPTLDIAGLVRAIVPLDKLEEHHIALTLAWLGATDDIYRRIKPATPNPHLVSYVVLVDPLRRTVFLGRHRKAQLWLPMGGHVEPGEHPFDTARREALEELGFEPDFTVVGDTPLMVTVTNTVGADSHTDVSLWFVIRGDRHHQYQLDADEFDTGRGRWWDIDLHAVPESDPHIMRFFAKLRETLGCV